MTFLKTGFSVSSTLTQYNIIYHVVPEDIFKCILYSNTIHCYLSMSG